jgi:3D (Asp-Asp-Asp) domain-containing protein
MRRSRRLTSAERWELGLFLSLLIVTCLCLAASLRVNSLPRLFAAGNAVETSKALAAPTPVEEIATEVQEVPEARNLAVPQTALPLPAERAAVTPPPTEKPTRVVKSVAKPAPAKPAADIKIYNGKKYRYVKTVQLRVTAYAPDPRCTYPYPGTTTASGLSVKTNGGKLVAADPNLIPMHSLVVVPGYAGGSAVPVLDTGGAIKGRRLDVLLPTFDVAKNWGSKNLEVKVYAPIKD